VPPESRSAVNDVSCAPLDGSQSAAVTTAKPPPDLCTMVDRTQYSDWDSPTCYLDGLYGYDTPGMASGTASTTNPAAAAAATSAHFVEYMPCNIQQRLVCGGSVAQYYSTSGAVPYEAIQQRALSDLSGRFDRV